MLSSHGNSTSGRSACSDSTFARVLSYLGIPLFLAMLQLLGYPAESDAQQEFEITIETTLGDTTETFWLQIPQAYDPGNACPLLLGWHQWGGNHWEMKNATEFDSIANARVWIAASHHGTSTTHWTNHATQSHVVDVIRWIQENYSIDEDRIYMVGASMGGAAGMVFSNNHLDPAGPMVAAAASISGIQDCERRFYEQGINNSMIEAFGGTPEQVPYEYHRNSAIYFADSTESMHFGARHLPLFLTFGLGSSDLVWRQHAEDLYEVLAGLADTVVLHESSYAGHGWVCAEEGIICDFLEGFALDSHPTSISIGADEEGHWYWADIHMREPEASFARIDGVADIGRSHLDFTMFHNVSSVRLNLGSIGFPLDQGFFACGWDIRDEQAAQLAFLGVPQCPAIVLCDGAHYDQWAYDPIEQILALDGDGDAHYAVLFDLASAPDGTARGLDPSSPVAAFPIEQALRIWPSSTQGLCYRLLSPGRLDWILIDPLGRRVAGAALGWREAGSGSIRLDRSLSSGVYLAAVRIDGPSPCRSICKITVVR
ncbi:MAG: hypothetical protein KAY24_06560 [Candidatus Eisenbacteria sp.]|nr:hypothetical protein [Candidatus Eisenbacteria bacterium]